MGTVLREHTTELFLKKLFHKTYLAGNFFFCQAGRAKTGWHSDTVIRCYRNLSFVMDICNFVRLGTGLIIDFDYFTFESFEIDKILFIAFRVKLVW